MIATPPIAPDSSTTASDTSPADASVSVRRSRRPGDHLNRATADLPARQREALRWLHAYGDERGLTNKALGELIGYSESTISRLFANERIVYGGNLDEVATAIEQARAMVDAQQAAALQLRTGRMPFIEAELTHHMWALCDAACEYRRMVPMWGKAQIGKSRNLKERANKRRLGRSVYVEMPTGGALSNFLANLCEPCRISPRAKSAELRRRAINFFKDGETELIIDQMHRLFLDSEGNAAKVLTRAQLITLDFIIELFDASELGFGLSLVGANIFRDGYQAIANQNFFRQIRGRSLHPDGCQLPDLPGVNDLNAYAAHYGLAPATGEGLRVQTEIIEGHGLAVWLTRLHSASMLAASKGRAMKWADVVVAHAFFGTLTKYNPAPVAVAKEVAA